MKNRIGYWAVAVAALGLAAIMAGCSGTEGVGDPGKKNDPELKSLQLVPFASCNEMAGEIKEVLIAEMEQQIDASKRWMCRGSVAIDDMGEAPVAAGTNGAQATGTNLQEPGVDEADLIKTDGKHAYAIVGNE
ncbi:MAG TPA: beta-propeller domain-containing protein, partial [bacterium]|nr:beta-propeller domain-containing protein [bacterium]